MRLILCCESGLMAVVAIITMIAHGREGLEGGSQIQRVALAAETRPGSASTHGGRKGRARYEVQGGPSAETVGLG